MEAMFYLPNITKIRWFREHLRAVMRTKLHFIFETDSLNLNS